MTQRACTDENALAAPAALATDELRQRLLLAHGSDAEPRALEAAAGQVPSCADRQIAAATAAHGSALGRSWQGAGLASPPRSPELVAAAARVQGSVEKAEANRDATAVADAFLAARRAARGTDARLPTALLAAAAPLLAPPAPPLPAPVAAEASAAVAVTVPPFASQAEPRVDAGAPLLATMLQQLDCCGWLGPGRIDAETAERLRSDFRPGAAAKALYEAARAFMASPQPELPRDIWCTCIELAKKHTKRGMFAYLQDRAKKSKARHETPSAEPYLPPGATQPMLSSKCNDVEVALLTYQQAGWFGPGPAHIGLPVSHLLRRWKNKPAVLSVLHRLPLVASSAEVAAGVPLSSILYEELIQVSRVLWPNEPATRNAAAEMPRRRDSPRRSRERRSRSRSRSHVRGWERRRSRSRERRSSRHEHRSRSRSRDRRPRQQSPTRSAAAAAAPRSAPGEVRRGSLDAPPSYHCHHPLTGELEPARPLQWFRERVLGGSIHIAIASVLPVWRAGALESTAAPLALILAAQRD